MLAANTFTPLDIFMAPGYYLYIHTQVCQLYTLRNTLVLLSIEINLLRSYILESSHILF